MKTHYSISLRKFFPIMFLLSVLCMESFPTQSAKGALSQYTFATGTGTRFNISSGTVLWTGRPRRSNMASGLINLGFSFTLDGTVYTQMQVYSSGLITLGAGTISSIQGNNLATTNVPAIAGFWGSSVMLSGGSNTWAGCGFNPTIRYQMIGIAPSRIMIVEFDHIDVNNRESLCTWQIRLYESTNLVEIYYAHMTSTTPCGGWNGSSNSTSASIGVTGGVNNYISVTPTNGTTATSSSSAANNSINLQSTNPTDNTLYTFSNPVNIQLSVFPKTLSYGSVVAGTTSAPICVTVKHAGTVSTLTIASAIITGVSDFQISSSPPSNNYSVGQTGQYCITFTPSQAGIRSAVLTISSNGRDSGVQTVKLTGVGIVADYTIDSLFRFKKTRTRLGDSLTQYLHITSIGLAPLFFSSFVISGIDAGQYYISHFPVNPLAPGQSDSIGITYVPTIEGKHIATLTLTSNSFTIPTESISLQGTGILPHIVITPTLLLFDSTREGDTVCKTVDIWNPGSDTLRILANVVVSNDGDFHYTGLSGSDTAIAPDQHKTVTVCFIPLQEGTRQARLLFRTNIIKTFETPRRDTGSTYFVDIHGTGVPFGIFANALSGPPVLDSAAIGTQVCRTDTLKNNGDADIEVTGYTFSGGVFSETLLPATPFLLKARTSITFTLCGTPNVEGLINGTLVFAGRTSGSNIATTLLLGVFGQKACVSAIPSSLFTGVTLANNGSDSSQCVMIINCGDIASVYTPTISGASKGDYSFKPAASGMIQKGDTAIFCIDYKPSAVGVSNASFDVGSSDGSSVKVPLVGADGCAVLTNTVPTVPSTGDNEKKQFTFTIDNTSGTFEWTPGIGSITGAGSGSYTIDSIVPNPIPAGKTGLVYVTFHPPLGSQNTTLTANITWPNGGPCGNALSIDLNGQSLQSSVKETASADGFVLEQTYPNPTEGKTNFNYATPSETEVRITLVDLTGRLIRTLITGRVTQGQHLVNFDVSNLPSGTYMYLLESGSTRLVRQLILTK